MVGRDEPEAPVDDGEAPNDDDRERRGLFERAIPDVVKRAVERAVESGVSRIAENIERGENLKSFMGDKLPKEALAVIYQQMDETKNGLYRVVAKEIRDVLEQTQFADELTKLLTKLSFEIKTEIRFIPNDSATKKPEDGAEPAAGLPKPEVKVSVRERGRDRDKKEPK
jgi:hypothetical protein